MEEFKRKNYYLPGTVGGLGPISTVGVPTQESQGKQEDPHPLYRALEEVLVQALNRCALGKGKERHATDNRFEEQPIITEGDILGIHPHIFQIRKKCLEVLRMDTDAAQRELLDVIVYAAAAHIILGRR